MQIWAESGKSALPICNYSQILYQFLMFTQNLKRSLAVIHNVSFKFFNCLLVIYFLHIGLFLNQHIPFSISFSVHSTDIILFLQGLHDSLHRTERFSGLCHKLFLLNGRIFVEQFQDRKFF